MYTLLCTQEKETLYQFWFKLDVWKKNTTLTCSFLLINYIDINQPICDTNIKSKFMYENVQNLK